MMKIGFIGLGLMGSRMAANLQKKGHDLILYNRTKEKAQMLLSKGAYWANSPGDVAKQVNIMFTMLSQPDAVAEVAFLGKHGFLQFLPKNSVWVDCSTVNPSFSKLMALESKKTGVRFVDAPVSGSTKPAEEGQLIFLVGGDKEDVDEVRPLLETMGKKIIHVGGHGMGTSMKMVINIALAESMIAFSEATVLGESLGIPKSILMETLLGSPVVAPFLAAKRAKFEGDGFEPEFSLRLMHKDLQLAADTAYEAGVGLPVENSAKELYALAMRNGFADMDFSAVYKFLKGTKTNASSLYNKKQEIRH